MSKSMVCPLPPLDDPRKAGAMDWDHLADMARAHPDLKPCGALNWHWIYRADCERCCPLTTPIRSKRR